MSVAVFYFGGFQASQPDIDGWLRSARLQKPDVIFRGFPWPSGVPAKGPIAKTLRDDGRLAAMVKAIEQFEKDQNGKTDKLEKIFLVGHSSGGAIANAVDADLNVDADVALVVLDGSMPSDSQLARDDTQVWGATCAGQQSRNFPGNAKGRGRVFQATNCKKEWPLHFSVVNTNASDANAKLVAGDLSQGYVNCRTNLMFLNRFMELH
jgi:pimeloyl-ACP methyl ester carboxylesterase